LLARFLVFAGDFICQSLAKFLPDIFDGWFRCFWAGAWRDACRPADVFLSQAIAFGSFTKFGQRPHSAFAYLMHPDLVLHADD
jgi:hypothetical protein